MGIDRNIHPPARLQLTTMLSAVSEAEFSLLRDELGVSDSVLSKHLSALGSVGYTKSRKGTHQGRRTTWVSLSPKGRKALDAHIDALNDIIATARRGEPSPPPTPALASPGEPAGRGGRAARPPRAVPRRGDDARRTTR